jgi:hypothetical protein
MSTSGEKICSFCGRYSKKTKSQCSGCQAEDKWYKPKDLRKFDTTKKGKTDDFVLKNNRAVMFQEKKEERERERERREERKATRSKTSRLQPSRSKTNSSKPSISKTNSQRNNELKKLKKKNNETLKGNIENNLNRLKLSKYTLLRQKKNMGEGKTTPEFDESLAKVELAIENAKFKLLELENDRIGELLSPIDEEPVLTEEEQKEFDELGGGRGRKTRRKRKRKRKRKTKRKRRRKTKRKNKRKTKRKRKTRKN